LFISFTVTVRDCNDTLGMGLVGDVTKTRLDYEEITPCLKEVTKIWHQMLNDPQRSTTQFDHGTLTNAVKAGLYQRI